MTKDEIMAMSDHGLRMYIAGLLGATDTMLVALTYPQKSQRSIIGRWEDEERGEVWKIIPDYPNDAGAIRHLLDGLKTSDQRDEYIRCLSEIVLEKPYPDKHSDLWSIIYASPRDQIRAFIMAMS